ncbi:MAG: hypothetical protein N2643_02305 [Endomicrobia bacterium]|nr:hypothetical protein [Endomicrobiia bacterium]
MSSSTVFITSTTQDNLFFFDQKKWNIVVERIENNLPLFEEEKTTVTTKPPVITPTTIEFMEGTQLSIAGRKLIGMEIKNVQYPYRKEFNRTDVNMKQELQVSVRGKVGKNVDVNIDIDDTQPDKRDISIIYRGEGVDVTPGAVGYKARPGAFIQEIAFGDIQLSLPNTEFVGYSRQVFGLKAVGQYKNAKLYLIASQSKGNFETKRFTGKLEFERKLLYDTSYVRRKYYKVAFGNYKIKKDSIKVYIDTLDPQRDPATLVSMTVQSFNLSTFTYTGKFEQLALGRDFIVDYAKGIIVFNLPTGSIQPHWVIAVDYIDENTNLSLRELKNTTNYILIKDKDENPEVTTELKNRYSIGRTNIVRDDGAGNFLLKITDKTDRILNPTYDKIQPGDKTVPVYKTGNMGDIIMDFENGEFYFLTEEPFVDDCYDKNPISRYNILIEYKYRLKTYFLKPFIVPYSERISVDGKLLQRNVDYWIDYDSGFINFLKEDIINENSVIEASYEYSMLGLQGGETLAGGRIELPLHRKLFVGSSWIGNLPSKGTNVPDIRNTPGSLQVWEADARILDIKFPFIPFKINSVSAEYAENEKNPNIWDKAIVENMEGITLEDSVSTYRHMWSYGSCSDIYIPGKYDEKLDKLVGGELFWDNEDVPTKEINPKRETTLEKQQVLRVNYDLYSSSEVAMVYTFSKTGLDFTKKLYIEIEYYSNNGGGELYLDIGQVNEDIDNDGTLDTEDKNLNGRLDIDEDSGFSYNAKSNQIYMVGSKNGRLDTEDLDADGILNTVERIGGRYKISDLNFTGWVSTIVAVQVTEKNIWSTVKHLKLSIRGHKKTGVIKISKISVVGNKFQIITPGNTKVFAVNNENDPSYKKLSELEDYSSIYGSMYEQTKIEQALAIEYDFDTYASSSIVNILFSRSQDFTYHHKLNFFIYNKTKNNIIVKYIAYTDANNFYEYLREIKNINLDEWIKCSIEQTDTNMDNIPDTWEADDNDISIKCSKIGKPNLQTITKLEIVIINPLNTPQKGIVYINDIYLSDSWKRKGIARKYDANFSVPGWVNFGLTFREVDRRFETFTSAITNQDNTSISGYFGLIKLGFLPIDFKGRQELTVTPSAIKAGELISKYQEGKRIYTEGSLSTSLIIPKFPTLNLAYTKSISSTTALSRTDMKDNIRLAFSYRNPIFKYVPIETISFTYGEEKFLLYPWVTALSTFTPSVDDSKYTSFNLPFNFWNKLKLNLNVGTKNTFTELRNFNISVGEYIKTPMLTVDKDIWNYYTNLTFFTLYNLERTYQIYYTSYSVVVSSYEKRNENNFSLDSSIELIPFLKPNLGYKVDIIEDYNFPISNRKDITRNSGGNFSISLTPKDFVRLKQIQTLRFTYNFNLTAADRYEKLPKNNRSLNFYTFDNLDLLWYKTSVSTANFFVTRAIERKEQRLNTSWKLFEGLPFKGNVAFLKKTDMNLSYSDAVEEKEETQTKTFTYTKVWPDMTFTLYDFDTLLNYILRKSTVFRDTKLDLSYSYKTTEIKKVSLEENKRHREMISFSFFEKYNMLINYENTNTTNFSFLLKIRTSYSSTDNLVFQFGMPFFGQRLTPKYEFRREIVKDARNLTTRDITTNSFSVSYYADIVPKQGGINIFGKTLPLQNRLRINSGLNYTRRESPIDIGKNNTDNFGFNARGDYDVSKYINVSVGVGTELNINRIIKTDTNYSFNINGQVIIRF